MKKLKQIITSAALVLGIGLVMAPIGVGAVSTIQDACKDAINKDTAICANKGDDVNTIVGAIVNTLLFLLGIAAVIVIIIGGITYTISAGNEAHIKRAKDMILYAVVGLVVAFSAYAIVNWVLKAFG